MWRSTLAILEGRFDDAEELVASFATLGAPERARCTERSSACARRGTVGASTAADTSPLDRELGRPAEYAYRSGYAWVLAGRAAPTRRASSIDWVAADDFARLGDDMNRLAALAELAQAMTALRTRRTRPACSSGSRPTPTATSPTAAAPPATARPRYHVARLNALLGRREEAERRFEEAAAPQRGPRQPLGAALASGAMELLELEGDHTEQERAELHDGEHGRLIASAFARVEALTVGHPGGWIELPVDTVWRPLTDTATWPAGPVSLPGLPF